jgi:hypothetical protein
MLVPAANFWAALRGEPVPEAAWPAIIGRARREGVAAFLAAVRPDCPGRETIRRDAAAAHLARLRLIRRVREIIEPIERPWAILKGIDLATRLYNEPPDRPSGDCDIMVRPEDRRLFSDRLVAAGFAPSDHHIELHTGREGQVDLHAAFVNADRITARRHVLTTPEGWETRRERLETEAGVLPVLGLEDLALYLAAHAIHHHGAVGARWLVDLHRLLDRQPEAESIIGRTGHNGKMLLVILKRLLGAATLESLEPSSLFDRLVLRAATEGEEIPGLRYLLSLREIAGARERLLFLRESLLPSFGNLRSADMARPREAGRPLLTHLRRTGRTAICLLRLLPAAIFRR